VTDVLAAPDQAHADLADRADIEALLRRFYGRVLDDDLLAEPFAEVRAKGLDSHLPVMCDFWETVLFRTGRAKGGALHVHRDVHGRTPLSGDHFVRWLAAWQDTVDEMYCGPVAEHAKVQANRIAWAMNRRLAGVDTPEQQAWPAG
jgi:hemoglobin